MAEYVTSIKTKEGNKRIDYNALANLPSLEASNIAYSNASTNLEATDTQAALDEIMVQIEELSESMNLSTLVLGVEKSANGQLLVLSDGINEKSVEIPIPVDDVLNITSSNPLQNRIIAEQFEYINEEITEMKENGFGGGGFGTSVALINQNGTSTIIGSQGSAMLLMFTFTSTENGLPTGDANCRVFVNGVQKINMSIPQGLTTIDVAPYLPLGESTVAVTCTDVYGKDRTLTYYINVVNLTITSTFNADRALTGDEIFRYVASGSIQKTIYFKMDGDVLGTVITSLSGKDSQRVIPKQSHGTHLFEVYSEASLNDIHLTSPILKYDLMYVEEGNPTPMISSVYDTESIAEGEQVSIPYYVYDPTKLTCDVTFEIFTKESGNEVIFSTKTETTPRERLSWETRDYPTGEEVYFRIKYGDIHKTHKLNVVESAIDIDVETVGAELILSSAGRSNNEVQPDVWEYGDTTTSFENVNWKSSGWLKDEHGDVCLRLSGGATATIDFQPFKDDIRTNGKTIELEFAIRDVNNRDAVPISCISGGLGFEVKADTAYIQSEQSNVFCNYKEEEKVHLAFVVESTSEYRMLSVYLNGVMSDAIQYPTTDNFQQKVPVSISVGSPYCSIDLYAVRSYNIALSDSTLTTNYIADINDIVKKTETYEENDIYDEFGAVSFIKAREKNSVMVIIGTLPGFKGDKKKCKILYYDVEDSNLSYEEDGVSIDVQGTSSQWYNRKNWKLKCSNEHYIDIDQLPGKVICIKVDYAEATGTHNTQNAVFVEKLYTENVPPQEANPKVRTTIYGKPILLFHQEREGATPVFYGKANYNWDKGAENVFGFTSDYDTECWEFKNNTSDPCLFRGEIATDWSEDFEARYPDGYQNIDRFKIMHDWVVSTRQDTATGNVLSAPYTDIDGNTHTTDTAAYRLAKFKTEFEDYFNMHYALIYYVYTFFALMVDQRAKNMFLTYWANTGQWYFYFYDNDTCFGINNEGGLSFDYYHEDHDQINSADVYNGQFSTLWINFRASFPDQIQETYQDLRSNSILNYDELVNQFITHGSDKWSESIYNEDGEFKYVSMLRSDNDATNLPQIRGTGEEHFKYFIENRLNYCDSKWYAGNYPNDYAAVRIYTPMDANGSPQTDLAIPANASITVTPYSHMYAGVRYKANGTLAQKRLEANETYTFVAPNEIFKDTETAIYGASQLSSLGDLSPLYLGYIDVGAATKLVELKIGNATPGYKNDNLYHLSVGSNRLLKKIDIQNCGGAKFNQALVLTGCPNIEEVYAKGSSITGVELPDSGYLKILQLPATIANLTLRNQLYIEDLTIEGYENIKTVEIENCPNIDSLSILDKAINCERARLTNVDWHWEDSSVLFELIDRNIAGKDENGVNTGTMWIDGKCHIDVLAGSELARIRELYPYLDITYGQLGSKITFMNEDGTEKLLSYSIVNGADSENPVDNGDLQMPTKDSTAQYHFTYAGWSLTPGGDVNANALKNIEEDRIVYVSFRKQIRSYNVNFYNGTTLLQTKVAQYGTDAVYTGATPVKEGYTNKEFEFIGWEPAPVNIQGNMDCYAKYFDLREITDDWETIAKNASIPDPTSKYDIGSYKKVVIGGDKLPYNFYNGGAVVYNNELHILGGTENSKAHYRWTGFDWVDVSAIPIDVNQGEAVVYNNEIHVLQNRQHYKWSPENGWASISTLPYNLYFGNAVVYNNELHILGSYNGVTSHFKFNDTSASWDDMGSLPYGDYHKKAIVYKDKIHLFGGTAGYTNHYHYNGTTWAQDIELPYSFAHGCAIIFNDELHIIGSMGAQMGRQHYKFNGVEWIKVSTLPFFETYGDAVVYNGQIHVLGSDNVDFKDTHYYFDGTDWHVCGEHEIIEVEVVDGNHDELIDGSIKWVTMGTWTCDWQAAVHNNKIYASYHGGCRCFDGNTVSGAAAFNGTYGTKMISYKGKLHAFPYHNNTENGQHIHYILNESTNTWERQALTPMQSSSPYYIVFNDLLYAFGGESGFTKTYYTYDGTTWTHIADDMPSSTKNIACVYDGVIHFIFDNTKHYTYDGTTWTFIGSIPFDARNSSMVAYNNELHIWGSNNDKLAHHKWNGSIWEICEDKLPYEKSVMLVMNNELYACSNNICKYVEAGWMNVGCRGTGVSGREAIVYHDTIYGIFNKGFSYWNKGDAAFTYLLEVPNHYSVNLLVFNDEIHLLCSLDSGTKAQHYKYNFADNEWIEVSIIPVDVSMYRARAVVYNNLIYLMTSSDGYYTYDGAAWSERQNFPVTYGNGPLVVYNGELHAAFGVTGNMVSHYKFDGTTWTKICDTPYYMRDAKWIVYEGKLCSMGGHFNSSYWYRFNGEEWVDTGVSLPFSGNNYVVYRNRLYAIGSSLPGENNAVRRYENPRASLTFVARYVLQESNTLHFDAQMPHWNLSALRAKLNDSVITELPTSLQNTIKQVNKMSDTGFNGQSLLESIDKLWIPSVEELGGELDNIIVGQGESYSLFTDNVSRIKTDINGDVNTYWTRSSDPISSSKFWYVTNKGTFSGANADNSNKVLIGFCI